MTRAPVLLEACNVRVQVAGRVLVDQLSLQVEPGQRWVLLGRNGAGKSRLLEVLLGLQRPAAGSVHCLGRPLGDWSPLAAARHRAFLPQQQPAVFAETALQAVLIGRHPHRTSGQGGDTAADVQLALQALADVGLQAQAHQQVDTLSGGERQRLALATLLVQHTPLLLLDEPLNHLDPAQQALLLTQLRQRTASGHGLVCSLHDLNQALAFATHVVLLDGAGGAVAGPAEGLLTAARLQALFGVALCDVAAGGRRWLLPASGGPGMP